MDTQAIVNLRPEIVVVDELAHTNIEGSENPEAVAGRDADSRRRDQRHFGRQHPAYRGAERGRRGDHGHRDPRAGPGQRAGDGRRGGEHRPHGRRTDRTAESRKDLPPRQDRRGARQLLHAGQPAATARTGAERGGAARGKEGGQRGDRFRNLPARQTAGRDRLLRKTRPPGHPQDGAHGHAPERRLHGALRAGRPRGRRPHSAGPAALPDQQPEPRHGTRRRGPPHTLELPGGEHRRSVPGAKNKHRLHRASRIFTIFAA